MITGYQVRWKYSPRDFWGTSCKFITRPEAEEMAKGMGMRGRQVWTEIFEVELDRCNRQLVQFPHVKLPDRVVRMLTLMPGHLVSLPGEPGHDWLYGVAYTDGIWYRVRKRADRAHAFSAWETCGIVGVSEMRPPKGANFTKLLQGLVTARAA